MSIDQFTDPFQKVEDLNETIDAEYLGVVRRGDKITLMLKRADSDDAVLINLDVEDAEAAWFGIDGALGGSPESGGVSDTDSSEKEVGLDEF